MNKKNASADKAAGFIRKKLGSADTAIILGSGLGQLADAVKNKREMTYNSIPGFVKSKVPGHSGRIITGSIGSRKIILMSGRIHYYEGYPMGKIVFMIDVLAKLGVKKLIVTNAGGSLRRNLKVPSLTLITDHINLMGANPLRGGAHFIDLTDAYDEKYRKLVLKLAKKLKITLSAGVYLALSGPSYETKAEIRMFRKLGADVVGMSTIPEVIAAKKHNMRIIGISCLTNYACGVINKPLSHKEVLDSGKAASHDFIRLINSILTSKEF